MPLSADQSYIKELKALPDSMVKAIDKNQFVFHLGADCRYFVIILEGVVRVELLSTTGHELLLYRIGQGQSCVVTTACLLGQAVYAAQAVTETPVELLLLPRDTFNNLLSTSEPFRDYVFNGFSERLGDLMTRTGELASESVDRRLASVLCRLHSSSAVSPVIEQTHDQLAREVGTAREVISRRLAVFEKQGILTRSRGAVVINDIEKLTALSQQ